MARRGCYVLHRQHHLPDLALLPLLLVVLPPPLVLRLRIPPLRYIHRLQQARRWWGSESFLADFVRMLQLQREAKKEENQSICPLCDLTFLPVAKAAQ